MGDLSRAFYQNGFILLERPPLRGSPVHTQPFPRRLLADASGVAAAAPPHSIDSQRDSGIRTILDAEEAW